MKKKYIEPILEIEEVNVPDMLLTSPIYSVQDTDINNDGFTFDDFFKFN